MARSVRVSEDHRGLSKSSNYYYVIDGKFLRHISEYAVTKSKEGDTAEYLVDLDKIRDKLVIEVSATNSGIICATSVFSAEGLSLDIFERQEKRVGFSYLNDLYFSFLKPEERLFLEGTWRKYYVPMLRELKSFVEKFERDGIRVSMPSLLDCQVRSEALYPLSYLIPYSDKAREKSLEGLTKFIHQAWVVSKLITELWKKSTKVTVSLEFESFKHMSFEQSSVHPVTTYELQGRLYSLWWEFDLNPLSMCRGVFWYRRIPQVLHDVYERASRYVSRHVSSPLRPDVVILRNARSCDDILNYGISALAVFECKNEDYELWADKVETQIKPYIEILKPDYKFVISMKTVPNHARRHLEDYKITVIDNAYPGGEGERELVELVQYLI